MFDYEKYTALGMDKVVSITKLDTDENLTPKFRKRIKWVGYTFTPFVLKITTTIVFIYIVSKIYTGSGYEKTVLFLLTLILLSLRGKK